MPRAAKAAALGGGADARSVPLQLVSPTPPKAILQVQARRRPEPEISWVFIPRIEPGEYPAFSRSASVYRDRQFKRWVCAVQFSIWNDSLTEVAARLTWYLNLGTREKAHVGRRGNYWSAWVQANGGPPKRNDRLSPRVFEQRNAIVRVADTTKTHQQNAITAQQRYSVIRNVVRWDNERPSQ
jgi:hypothetical protein